MSTIPQNNPFLDKLHNSYSDERKKKKDEKSDALGKDAFLTMLVAQLQNQDPLNPMEGSDFSAQLAQFSQLEQLMDLNESVKNMSEDSNSSSSKSDKDLMSYLGHTIEGKVDKISVEDKIASVSGSYTLSKDAEVKVEITNEEGEVVRTLYEGEQKEDTYQFKWDAKDDNDQFVEDGTYKYQVMANSGKGYEPVSSKISGKVEGIEYKDDKPFLKVDGVLIEPKSVTLIQNSLDQGQNLSKNIMDYLGKTVTTAYPQMHIENGNIMGSHEVPFHLDHAEPVLIRIYNESGELVRKVKLSGTETNAGENTWSWDGFSEKVDGEHVSTYKSDDGLYVYTVESESGPVNTDVTEQVSGIKKLNGVQFLVLKDSQRLVSLPTIKGIEL